MPAPAAATAPAPHADLGRRRSDLLFPANRRLLAEARALGPDLAGGEAIEGLIHPREGLLLYMLARRAAHVGNVVEVGSYLGKSTWYLARGLIDAGSPYRVVSIDPHPEDHYDRYLANIRAGGVADRVEPHVGYSYDVVRGFDRPVGLVWIDGDHEYAAVQRDFEDWFPHLAEGGWIAFHDTVNMWQGPTRVVRELLTRRDDVAQAGVMWLITYAQKRRPSVLNRPRALAARGGFELLTLAQARHAGIGAQVPR